MTQSPTQRSLGHATRAGPSRVADNLGSPVSALALLATDGSAEAAGAASVAGALARQRGTAVRSVTVLEWPSDPGAGLEPTAATVAPADSRGGGYHEERLKESVLRQLKELIGDETASAATFVRGRAVPMIVHEAEISGASLILLGLYRHDAVDWLSGAETALRVARTSPVPLFAVTPSLRRLPRRIVVAIDFSPASVRAAHQVFSLAADGARLILAHVRPPVSERDHDDHNAHYELGVGSVMSRLVNSLPAVPRLNVETVSLEGEPVAQLRDFAIRSDADLIVLGSNRHAFVTRLMLGSVTTELIRSANTSLFVVPPRERPPEA